MTNICFINLSIYTNYPKIKIIALYDYLMLSKVNQWRLSVYKYLYLEKFLSKSTEVIVRFGRALTDVLIFAILKILRKNNKI
jgi:hypothetical protein